MAAPSLATDAEDTISVLLVEDNPADVYLVRRILADTPDFPASVEAVGRLSAAIDRLQRPDVDLVLLDLSLPDSSGLETFRQLTSGTSGRRAVPVVVLSGYDDERTALEAVRVGAQDYLVKGKFNSALLGRTLRYAIERHRLQTELHALSLTDDLTGLYNRRGFLTLAAEDMRQARRRRGELVLAFADVDGLKAINDRYGHTEGDRAIRDAALILRHTFRESDLVARLGGDEFIVLLRDASADAVDRARMRLARRLQEHNNAETRPYRLVLSMGFARERVLDDASLDRLIAAADQAMYRHKHADEHDDPEPTGLEHARRR
jgi:two-component system cell cycle response regulator